MAKITSRVGTTEHVEALRDLVRPFLDVGEEPATDLEDLVPEVAGALGRALQGQRTAERRCERLGFENISLRVAVEERDLALSELRDGVPYDEDLDYATLDLMEALAAGGVAEPTFDGELAFESGLVMSREDLKPYLRAAIERWLRLRIG